MFGWKVQKVQGSCIHNLSTNKRESSDGPKHPSHPSFYLKISNPTLFWKQPNIFYLMKSKLQTSIAELHKLKNQIRVQLNLLRPCGSPLTLEKKEHSTKKQFGKQFQTTDIIHPSAQKSQTSNKDRKRFYNTDRMVLGQTSRSAQKKHYERHYTDSVRLENSIKKRTCSYFNIRNDSTPSPSKHENTSLTGIGVNDKSTVQQSKSCIRVYYNRMRFNPNYY